MKWVDWYSTVSTYLPGIPAKTNTIENHPVSSHSAKVLSHRSGLELLDTHVVLRLPADSL